jgi:hypothetical protein
MVGLCKTLSLLPSAQAHRLHPKQPNFKTKFWELDGWRAGPSRDTSMTQIHHGVEKLHGFLSLAVSRCATPVTAAVELVSLN